MSTRPQEEEKKQYVLVSAVLGRAGKKLHWVIAEGQKRRAWFLQGKPADSLCGIHSDRIVEIENAWQAGDNDRFIEYSEDQLYKELKYD